MADQSTRDGLLVTARGDVQLDIKGERHVLSLTLAALAEMEAALGVEGFAALGQALSKLNAEKLTHVLTALLRAGGATPADELARQADPVTAARAVSACFEANLK